MEKYYNKYLGVLIKEIKSWIEIIVSHLPNFVVAILVMLAFGILSKIVGKVVNKVFSKAKVSGSLQDLAVTISKVLTICVGIIVALGVLELQKTVMSLLAGVGILGLALGFAFQDLAANFIAGVLMAFRKPFKVGDVITSNDYTGTVRKMNMRNTLIENFYGQYIIIPNKEVFENPLVNYSYIGIRRVEIKVGVAYNTNLDQVVELATNCIKDLDFIIRHEDIVVWAEEFGDSSINFSIRFWIDYPGQVNYKNALSKGIIAIKKAFDQAHINIPFPIRTIDLSMAKSDINELSHPPQ